MIRFDSDTFLPQVAIDSVIFGYKEGKLKVLISKLHLNGDFYAIPSGFIYQNEGLEEAAIRIVSERTGISNIHLEHFKNFGEANRSNSKTIVEIHKANSSFLAEFNDEEKAQMLNWLSNRFISIAYYALVDMTKVTPQKTVLDYSLEWYDLKHLPEMVLDHCTIIKTALHSLRQNLDKNIIIMNLLPETFIMKEVQDLYETIFEEKYARNNFQKKILSLNVLERLEKKFTGAQNKAPYLYRFKKKNPLS